MTIPRTLLLAVASFAATLAAAADPAPKPAAMRAPTMTTIEPIDWKDLSPPDYRVEDVLHDYYEKVAKLEDHDPRAAALADELRAKWDAAPAVASLDGKVVKLTGFIASLDGAAGTASEFILVPFLGMCVHFPPPPANQTVLVRTGATPYRIDKDYTVVTVTGRLRTEYVRNKFANASYTLEASSVEKPK